MYRVFLDFEMHPIPYKYSEIRRRCMSEIIEIGAVMLDDKLEEIDSYKVMVKPHYAERIFANIASLTGITHHKLEHAEEFDIAFPKFVEWCVGAGEEFKIYSWSASDLMQVKDELKIKEVKVEGNVKKMLDNWIDFQEDYTKILGLKETPSLSKAVRMAGYEFTGKMHDALFDARNTGRLFKLAQNKEDLIATYKMYDKTVKASKEKTPATQTLGSMFDFSQFGFTADNQSEEDESQ